MFTSLSLYQCLAYTHSPSPRKKGKMEGMIKVWTQKDLYHDPCDVIISPRITVNRNSQTTAINENVRIPLFFLITVSKNHELKPVINGQFKK